MRSELKHIVFSRFLISPEGNQIHKDLVDAILAHYAQTGPVCQIFFLISLFLLSEFFFMYLGQKKFDV